ncbi:hypothetical protein EDD16DRAFT_1527191 [Pisolithus croceorrhizus]|nr:hypothetical protein EV401DRAFT_2082663 [Pisolithus croceorrhizus]KAI6098421.1 hypothetical protein EDD16DRAFT_1527191 [Pisolithus croceorrhizus]KAI6167879.1 hypothetical protein EDD17DRAFT_1750420 [Pisolithus thermaeus]
MFVKNSLALQDDVDCILIIFKRLIVNSGRLEEVAKLQQWRDAVRDIRGELEAVRSIANRTNNVLHMLIGMDKYIHWMENIGTPGIPFPNWHQALFPPIKSITSHPWLLTVKQQYNAGLQLQMPAATTELAALTLSSTSTRNQVALRLSTVPCMTTTGSKGHIPTCSTLSARGKAQATPEELVAISEEKLITQEDDKGDKSKVVEEDIKMDEAIVEPACG